METVKIEDKKYGDIVVELFDKSIWINHEDGTKIQISKQQALTLSIELYRNLAEWISVDVKPNEFDLHHIRLDNGFEAIGWMLNGVWRYAPKNEVITIGKVVSYTPIIRPK